MEITFFLKINLYCPFPLNLKRILFVILSKKYFSVKPDFKELNFPKIPLVKIGFYLSSDQTQAWYANFSIQLPDRNYIEFPPGKEGFRRKKL
jgi:hypothetical protein